MPQRISLPFQSAFADEGLEPRRHLGNLYNVQNREDDHQLPTLAVVTDLLFVGRPDEPL